jgi:hypothetical protein
MGASLVGVVGLIAGLATGFGWLEYSVIGGAVVSGLWLITGEGHPSDPWRWFRWGGVAALLVFLILLPLIVDGGTLGHDESAYALKARQWLEGTPGSGWSPHRAIGMSAYGYVVLALGGSEAGLRLLGLTGAMALAAGVWALGNRLADARVGAIASIAVVAGPSVLFRSTEYLSDVPSAALLVWCMVVVWRELEDRDLPTFSLLWVLPLAWGAFYLRYQSILSLALIGVVAIYLWWPKIRQRPAPVAWLAGIGFVGLIPHFAQAIDLTGTPWGIILNTGNMVRAYIGEGLVDYVDQFPWSLAGWIGPMALTAALVGLIVRRREAGARRRYTFLLMPAAAQVFFLGLVSHGEPRFLFFPLALVVVAGSLSVSDWITGVGKPWSHVIAWVTSILVVGSLALSAPEARQAVEDRSENSEAIEVAAHALGDMAGGESCGVLTSYTPQITFYSACASEIFGRLAGLRGDVRFMVLIEGGKRQPVGEDLVGFIGLTTGPPVVIDTADSGALIYRFQD